MLNWIRDHILGGARKLVSLGRATIDTISHIWSILTRFWHILRGVYAEMGGAIQHWIGQVENAIGWLARRLREVAYTLIPKGVSAAFNHAARWAAARINDARNHILGLLSQLRDWAAREIGYVRNLISHGIDDLRRWVSDTVGWVRRYGARIVDLVLHPEHMVLWILPALWGPLWRYLQAHAAPIGVWVMRRSVAAVPRLASTIESVLARIL